MKRVAIALVLVSSFGSTQVATAAGFVELRFSGPDPKYTMSCMCKSLVKEPTPTELEPVASKNKVWTVHNNGKIDRPVYLLNTANMLNQSKAERATYGEPCGGFVKRVGTTKLEYRRLVRNPNFISICVGK